MARVRFLPDELDVEALADETLLNASTRAGIPHTHACGGNARCSTCRVIVLEGVENCAPRTGAEHAIAAHLQFDVQVQLACQTRVTGPVTVRRLVLDEQDLALVEDEMRKPGIEAVGAIHGKSFDIGIGLHYGEVSVGSVGASADKRRTVVGDAVNFASRIETANKNADTNFLMSEAAYLQVANEVEVNQCPPWDIRGKTDSYNLFEVVRPKL